MKPAPTQDLPAFDHDGCLFAAAALILIDHGPWCPHEQSDAIDTLVLIGRGHTNNSAASEFKNSGVLRGRGYVSSVRQQIAELLYSRPAESLVA